MKKILYSLILIVIGGYLKAQVLQSNGSIYVNNGATLFASGTVFNTGNIVNAGTFQTSGDIINNSSFTSNGGGKLKLSGSNQSLDGSGPISTGDFVLSSNIVLNTPVKVEGTLSFGNGILTAAKTSAPLIFGDAAIYTGAANASHVNGYVLKEGLGKFTYPVGDETRYQPIDVDLTVNDKGMRVHYLSSDAGAASFLTTGTSSIALEAFNNQEYWDLTPIGTSTGKVTLFWDDYNNPSISSLGNTSVFKVAHKTDAGWLNEGGTVNGTLSFGSVTSEVLSAWSPFTLGAVPESALPVTLTSFSAVKKESASLLLWSTTSEVNSKKFDVQRSPNGKKWDAMGSVTAVNSSNSLQSYQFLDNSPLEGHNLYRLKMIDLDGSFTYSRIQAVIFGQLAVMTAYPNPSSGLTTVQLGRKNIGGQATLTSASGQILQRVNIEQETVSVDLGSLAAGMYLLQAPDGKTVKVIKQ